MMSASVLMGQSWLKGQQLATNSVGNPKSRAATVGKLAGGFIWLNLFEPLKGSIIKKER
jgi:hypothetical protein